MISISLIGHVKLLEAKKGMIVPLQHPVTRQSILPNIKVITKPMAHISNIFEYLIFQSLAIIQNAIGSKNTAPYNLIFAAVFRLPSASITANNFRLNTPTSMKKIVTKNISYHFRLKVFLKHINHMYTISPDNVRVVISACWDIHVRISFNVFSPSSSPVAFLYTPAEITEISSPSLCKLISPGRPKPISCRSRPVELPSVGTR